MNNNIPVSPRPLSHLATDGRRRVFSVAQLRRHGVSTARATERCGPGGPWQQLLPGVYLLHQGPPTSSERLQAALLYAGRPAAQRSEEAAGQPAPRAGAEPGEAMITGLAALALHGFSSAPTLLALDTIDVLMPRTRRLRSSGYARLIRTHALPRPEQVTGVPVAPVPRALADAVAGIPDPGTVRLLLTEAVHGDHCEMSSLIRELSQAKLLKRPHVERALESLRAESRARAEALLYAMVRGHRMPEPLWNVDLALPGGPCLGSVDAYWPDHGVAVELDTRTSRTSDGPHDAPVSEYARKRRRLEQAGLVIVHLTPAKLKDSPAQQATVVAAALTGTDKGDLASYVVVLPR